MSKRGRRRNSRRKSSSSSKQSVPPYNLQKQNNQNSVNFKDENVEKGETDSFRKENVQSGSEEEEKNIKDPEGEKNIKGGPPVKASPSQTTIYRKTSEDTERGVKIVTSVSVSDMEDSSTSIIFQQSHGPLPEGPTRPVTNVMTISCSGSHLKLEIQEFLQHHPCGTKTVFAFMNGADSLSNSDGERRWTPSERPSSWLSSPCGDKTTSGPTVTCDRPNYPSDRRQPASGDVLFGDHPLLSTNLQEKRRRFFRSFSSDQFWDVPPPQEFSDLHSNSLEDLTRDPASRTTRWPFSGEAAFFDQLSESDNYEPMFMRPCSSTNRESFTEDFINYQKRRSWIRNNSIAAVEHRECWFPMKRSQTFPGMPEGLPTIRDPLLPEGESLSSLISLPLQSEELGGRKFSAFRAGSYGSFSNAVSEIPKSQYGNAGSPESNCRWRSDPIVVADRGFDQEMVEVEHYGPEPLLEKVHGGALTIHVIPPAPSAHNEKVEDGSQEEEVPVPAKQNKSSVKTMTVGANEQRLLQPGSGSSPGGFMGKDVEDPSRSLLKDLDVHPSNTKQDTEQEKGGRGAPEGPDKPECPTKSCDIQPMETLSNPNTLSRSSSDSKAHLKPVPHKDPDSSEHWAKRRKLFKESKQWSSAGGSSITSDITEESVSEETRSMDLMIQDNEDRGFYTETFHSSAWIYQSRDVGSPANPPSPDASTRTASVRERTVRISKGSGEYPWGFRIQFSKPIVVTEVDTNGAAEEAGLMVGDFVLAVNGTDVTSIPHSEAADLARQGPDLLTLTSGSDIARCPNTPRPSCRGYLHKRTQSGLIKGWRKRWFVLTYDCCLYYYRHKRDEGKRRALSAVKLEGAEVGPDVSLGKPFVFKCRPQSANRVFFFCTTSNQEMKRWLEAMEKAVHPNTQNHVWEDVTRHNSCLPPLAVKNPECLGLLHRMDKSRETWVQHYCILKDGCLYFYSSIRATHAHGGIYLQGYVVREQPCGSKKSTIELKPPSEEFKTFFFSAENPDENKRWITAIKASVKNWLPFHQLLQDYRNRPAEETRM